MNFTTLMSSSSGNCIYVASEKTRVLVDMGCSLAYLKRSLIAIGQKIENIDGVFLTHEHSDHIKGVASLMRKYGIPVYASPLTWPSLPFYQEFSEEMCPIFSYGMKIGDLTVDFFRLSHDASQPVGLVFDNGQQKVGIATDTGQITPSMEKALQGVDGLILEANHSGTMLWEGPYPYFLKKRVSGPLGHLSNSQSGSYLAKMLTEKTKVVLLAHLSEKNNRADIALREVTAELRKQKSAFIPQIHIAAPKEPHPLICL